MFSKNGKNGKNGFFSRISRTFRGRRTANVAPVGAAASSSGLAEAESAEDLEFREIREGYFKRASKEMDDALGKINEVLSSKQYSERVSRHSLQLTDAISKFKSGYLENFKTVSPDQFKFKSEKIKEFCEKITKNVSRLQQEHKSSTQFAQVLDEHSEARKGSAFKAAPKKVKNAWPEVPTHKVTVPKRLAQKVSEDHEVGGGTPDSYRPAATNVPYKRRSDAPEWQKSMTKTKNPEEFGGGVVDSYKPVDPSSAPKKTFRGRVGGQTGQTSDSGR